MPSVTITLMPPTTLEADQVQDPARIVDLGAYRYLEVLFRVLNAGTAGDVILQSNTRNEADGWTDITGLSQPVGTVDDQHKSSANFLRYVRWVASNAIAGNPTVQIDLVAKE